MRQSRNDGGIFYASVHVLVKTRKVGKSLHSYPCKLYISMWLNVLISRFHPSQMIQSLHGLETSRAAVFFQKRSIQVTSCWWTCSYIGKHLQGTLRITSREQITTILVASLQPSATACWMTVKHRNYLQHVLELVSTSSLVWGRKKKAFKSI